MSRASDAANAVVHAVEQILDLYGVQHTREQSRVVMVPGAAGRTRPMFFGKWIDDNGEVHSSGRADILARPKIRVRHPTAMVMLTGLVKELHSDAELNIENWKITIPLWIECKSGKGTLSPDQRAFRAWVTGNGDEYLLIHDDARPLISWLEEHGVRKEPKRIIHAEPMSTGALDDLPCKHCGSKKHEHTGTIHACKSSVRASAMGKVWSPKLTTTAKKGK